MIGLTLYLCYSEIQNDYILRWLFDHEIICFYITMNNTFVMQKIQSSGSITNERAPTISW